MDVSKIYSVCVQDGLDDGSKQNIFYFCTRKTKGMDVSNIFSVCVQKELE